MSDAHNIYASLDKFIQEYDEFDENLPSNVSNDSISANLGFPITKVTKKGAKKAAAKRSAKQSLTANIAETATGSVADSNVLTKEKLLDDLKLLDGVVHATNECSTNYTQLKTIIEQYQLLMEKCETIAQTDVKGIYKLSQQICKLKNKIAKLSSTKSPTTTTHRRRSARLASANPAQLVDLTDDGPPSILAAPTLIVLDSDEEAWKDDVLELENYEIRIKVKWKGNIEDFVHRRHQKFAHIIDTLASRENANPGDLMLTIDDAKIVHPEDTPYSIDYKIYQFITGRIVEGYGSGGPSQSRARAANKNFVSVKIQSDKFSVPLVLTMERSHSLAILTVQCAEELKCKPEELKLIFDGETIKPDWTPDSMGIDDGEVFDLRFVDLNKKR